MKKSWVITASAVVAIVGGITLFNNVSSADKLQSTSKVIPAPPSKPANEKVKYLKNSDKQFKSADEFLADKKDNIHNKKEAQKGLREKVLYKDIRKVVPESQDVMHWVDPDRQIYVISDKFDSLETLQGTWTNATILTYYDAETGDELGYNLTGYPPKNATMHGGELKQKK